MAANLLYCMYINYIYYSTYKNKCADRDVCPSFATECESPTMSGHVNHLVFSSEPLEGENVWHELAPNQIVGVDWRMQLKDFGVAAAG